MKVGALIANFSVEPGHYDTGLPSVRGAFLLSGKFALIPLKSFLGLPEVFGVPDSLSRGEDGKGLEPHVDANLLGRDRLRNRNILNREANVPPVELPLNSAGLNPPLDGAMESELQSAYLRELETLRSYPKTPLRICEGVVSALSFKTRISSLASFILDSTEKVLKGAVNSLKDILKDLGVDFVKNLDLILVGLKRSGLIAISKTLPRLFVGVLPVEKRGVVEDTANLKGMFKRLGLFLCRIEAVFKSFDFQHIFSNPQELLGRSKQENTKDSRSALPKASFLPPGTPGISVLQTQTSSYSRTLKVESVACWQKGYVCGR